MLFSSIGREGIGLKDTLARSRTQREIEKIYGSYKRFDLASRNQISSRAAHLMAGLAWNVL
jgi:hypothetical protein